MNKDKQIEEMAKLLCEDCGRTTSPCADDGGMCTAVYGQAEYLYNAGYRKASDVAREIFEEIESNMTDIRMEFATLRAIGGNAFEKLKKKYTEGDEK